MGKHFCCKTTDGYEIFYTDEEEKNFKENCKAVKNSRVTIFKEDLGKIEAEIISLRRLKSKAVALLKKKNSIIKELIFNVEKNEDLLFKIKNLQARGDLYKEAYNDYQKQTEENFDKEVRVKVARVLESINNGNLIIEMAEVIKNEQKKNAVLEAENLQLREKIRELEGKFNRYVPGVKDLAHEKERGE